MKGSTTGAAEALDDGVDVLALRIAAGLGDGVDGANDGIDHGWLSCSSAGPKANSKAPAKAAQHECRLAFWGPTNGVV
jgi:hypothetical protein